MGMPLSRDERLEHAEAVEQSLHHRLVQAGAQVVMLNIVNIVGGLSADKQKALAMALEPFAVTVGMTSRLEALGIDPERAVATRAEQEAQMKLYEQHLPPSFTAKHVHVKPEGVDD